MPETDLDKVIRAASKVKMTDAEREKQRRSFAYGNTHFENEQITREAVDRAADRLKATDKKRG